MDEEIKQIRKNLEILGAKDIFIGPDPEDNTKIKISYSIDLNPGILTDLVIS